MHNNADCEHVGRLLFGRLQLIKLVPTLASTFALLVTLKCSRNPLALPAVALFAKPAHSSINSKLPSCFDGDVLLFAVGNCVKRPLCSRCSFDHDQPPGWHMKGASVGMQDGAGSDMGGFSITGIGCCARRLSFGASGAGLLYGRCHR